MGLVGLKALLRRTLLGLKARLSPGGLLCRKWLLLRRSRHEIPRIVH